MSFYQNPFNQDFQGVLNIFDKTTGLTFSVKGNQNTSDSQLAWNYEPYDLSTDNTLTINYAFDTNFKNWASLSINVAGSTAASTKASEVVSVLNDNAIFSEMFIAEIKENKSDKTVYIRSKSDRQKRNIKIYISNNGAEKKLRFNKKAGVAEIPDFFEKHTISNRFNFSDSLGLLIKLDETDAVIDQPIIEEAGFVPGDMLEDWELLAGRSNNLFIFKKQTVDASSRVTEIIEYGAGAKEGDLAIKTTMSYTSTKTSPDKICKIPYVLTSGDLVTP